VATLLADLARTTGTAVVCATHDETLIAHAGKVLALEDGASSASHPAEQADARYAVSRVPRSGDVS
jgi:ABC-type lipoprotein export system ATPase subunit